MADRKTLTDVANVQDAWTPEERAFIEDSEVNFQEGKDDKTGSILETPMVLVPKSVRIEQAVDNALTRAVADRKVRGVWPKKHQDIINEALKAWLKEEGYWPE